MGLGRMGLGERRRLFPVPTLFESCEHSLMVPLWADPIQISKPFNKRPWWEAGMGLGIVTCHLWWRKMVVAQYMFAAPKSPQRQYGWYRRGWGIFTLGGMGGNMEGWNLRLNTYCSGNPSSRTQMPCPRPIDEATKRRIDESADHPRNLESDRTTNGQIPSEISITGNRRSSAHTNCIQDNSSKDNSTGLGG